MSTFWHALISQFPINPLIYTIFNEDFKKAFPKTCTWSDVSSKKLFMKRLGFYWGEVTKWMLNKTFKILEGIKAAKMILIYILIVTCIYNVLI